MAVHVLVAEGSMRVRDAIRQRLECIGCQIVAEAETTAQAVPLFMTVRPQVVTMGMSLSSATLTEPVDLLRLFKTEIPETSVVVLGGSALLQHAGLFLEAGALECVGEPFDARSFERLWRKLSGVYPELKMRGFGPILGKAATTAASTHSG